MAYLQSSGANLSFDKSGVVQQIYVTSEDVVVVSSDGEARFKSTAGGELRYVTNSQDTIFQDTASKEFYVLLAGRWYGSPTLSNGTWREVKSSELPSAFAEIDSESDMGWVKIHVAGTVEAKEARADAIIPHTNKVKVTQANSLDISYDGKADFAQIKDTDLHYAVNTSAPVFRYKSKYYACIDAVWYESFYPNGPWKVATKVPASIYQIPEDHPHYNVTYVYIYDTTPEYVYVGYTSGYRRVYVYGGCVVYGAGHYYAWRRHYRYHYRYHHPCHYSRTRVRYNSSTGRWGVAHYSSGRYTARVGHTSSAGSNWIKESYNRRTRPATRPETRPSTLPNNRLDRAATLPNRKVPTRPSTLPAKPTARPSTLPATPSVGNRVSNGNVYSDRKGNVYRNQNGNWQQRKSNGWNNTKLNSTTKSSLNNASKVRTRGTTQTRSASTVRRSTRTRSTSGRSAPSRRGGGRRR